MFRIDSDGVATSFPTPEADGASTGYFRDGDPGAGEQATQVTADWLNAVQEEIVNVIDEVGAVLDKTDRTQLLTAIQSLIGTQGKYKYTNGAAATTWTITHNLGSVDHIIQCFDTSEVLLTPDSITRAANTTTVVWSVAQDGTALLMKIA